jgi:uroporphyrin-III C-methyltransferase/precorrin-2 dehydrogenase/sirohydrochlorin ferrochelatase
VTRPYYPVALDLADRSVLLVGGGTIAEGKADGLLEAGARVTVVSPMLTPRLLLMATEDRVVWHRRTFQPADVEGAWIVIAATDDRSVNAEVAALARAAGRMVNAVDDVPSCDFIATSIVRRGDLQISISTGGGSPAMARWMREQLDAALPEELDDLLRALSDVRAKLKAHGTMPAYPAWKAAIETALASSGFAARGQDSAVSPAWEPAAVEAPPDLTAHGQDAPAARAIEPSAKPGGEAGRPGTVYLVGAGPGDPGLLTLRALTLLRSADVVVHDHLVDERVLRLTRVGARLLYVGKEAGQHRLAQPEINQALVDLGRAGQAVVRLKGGDPFVFGRGGEEALALAEAGVPFEVVPGISSALAAPAAAGIPVTHRGLASAVTIVTGHECGDGDGVDWTALGRSGSTLVVLMGMSTLPAIVARLLAAGRSPDEPVAIVQNATRPDQRALRATLSTVIDEAHRGGFGSPATIVVGAVAALHEQLAPLTQRPLEVALT